MCTNINVTLPTVVSFLMLYSLRCGCIIICLWTVFRALFFLIFFTMALIEMYVDRSPPLGHAFATHPKPPATYEHFYMVLVGYLFLIVTECFLAIFTIFLGMGLYYESPERFEHYLICRFLSWLIEIAFLTALSLTHFDLIGWYLVFLMIVILEFYGFIVVYSYYTDVLCEICKDEDDDLQPNEAVKFEC